MSKKMLVGNISVFGWSVYLMPYRIQSLIARLSLFYFKDSYYIVFIHQYNKIYKQGSKWVGLLIAVLKKYLEATPSDRIRFWEISGCGSSSGSTRNLWFTNSTKATLQ
jgi:hypothetical protein